MKSGRSSHIAYLDGLRGYASLIVLVGHCMIWGGWYWHRWPTPKTAVDIFMVLSGYLMVYQWYAKEEDAGRITSATVSRFYLRRFFRIAPLYYGVLILTFVLGTKFLHGYAVLHASNPSQFAQDTLYDPANIHYTLKNFLVHLTFVFGLIPQYSFSTFLPDWSISLEMQFYLAFPFVLLAFRRIGTIVTLIGCLIAMRLWARTGIGFPEPSFLLLKLSVFMVGMLVAEAVRSFEAAPWYGAVLALLAVLIAPHDTSIVALVAILLFFMGSTASITPSAAISRVREAVNLLLGNRFTNFLADTSYAVYLTHGFFVSLLGGWLFSRHDFLALSSRRRVALLTLGTMLGCYALAWVLHRLIEQPGIRLGRKVTELVPRGAGTSPSLSAAPAMST